MIMTFMLTSFSLEQNDALFIVGLGMKTLRQNMKTFILNKNVTEIKKQPNWNNSETSRTTWINLE